MTQCEAIVDFFRRRGGSATLGELLQYPFGYRFIQRKHDLKKRGIVINLVRQDHDRPSNNLYQLLEADENGQMRFA